MRSLGRFPSAWVATHSGIAKRSAGGSAQVGGTVTDAKGRQLAERRGRFDAPAGTW